MYKMYIYKMRKDQKDYSTEFAFYSMQRIDILLISISGAGIFACWEIYKFVLDKYCKCFSFFPLKLAAGLFLATIIINFISQFLAYYNNLFDATGKENLAKKLDPLVNIANFSSVVTMISGLISICYFVCHL